MTPREEKPPAAPRDTDLIPYTGRWVAILGSQVVGDGRTPEEARRKVSATRGHRALRTALIPPAPTASLPALLKLIAPALPDHPETYVVGGAVRDHLLGRAIHDLDFVLNGPGIPAARRAADVLGGEFYTLDDERSTGRVLLRRVDGSRLVLDFAAQRGNTLEEDQRGRDFTVNAMAIDAADPDRVFDPLHGAQDLREKRLRTCSERSFEEDPLRVLRAIRIAVEYRLHMAPDTRRLLREATPHLGRISAERRRDEIFKILGSPQPALALSVMDRLGVFERTFPELVGMKGVAQSPPHVHDVWDHTLSAVAHLSRLLDLLAARAHNEEAAGSLEAGMAVMRLGRFRTQFHEHLQTSLVPERSIRALLFLAVLFHDAGKPATRSLDDGGRIRFLRHEAESARLAAQWAAELRLSNEERSRLKTIVRHHMRPHFLAGAEGLPSRRAVYRYFRDTRAAGVDICLLTLADLLASYERTLPQETWSRYLDLVRELLENWWERPAESVRPPQIIRGTDLMERFDLEPGPLIGRLLERIREAQAAGEVDDADGAFRLAEAALRQRDDSD